MIASLVSRVFFLFTLCFGGVSFVRNAVLVIIPLVLKCTV